MSFRADKIAPDLWKIRPGAGEGNCYLLTERQILIDTGAGRHTEPLLALLETLPDRLRWILLTHEDLDHTGGASRLAEATGAHVACHSAGAGPISEGRPRSFGSSLRGRIVAILAEGQNRLARHSLGVPIDRSLASGESVGGLVALYMPGHSPGSCSYYEPDTRRLFTGDTCITKNQAAASPSPTWPLDQSSSLFCWNRGRAERSLASVGGLSVTGIYPGHGPPFLGSPAEIHRAIRSLLMLY